MKFRSRGRACSALPIILALGVGACHITPRPGRPQLSPLQQLQHDIDAILAAPAFEHSIWGVLVTSLSNGDTLYSVNARKLLMPGSNMKIVTLAAAADRLGWNYKYETRLLATAPIDGGVLAGDLIVVGSGDPGIGGRDGPATRVFDAWADELVARGLRRIDGRIIGDDRAFDAEPLGAGWTWEDLGEGYSAGVSALQFNENAVRAAIAPGLRAGDPAIVTVDPPGSGLVVLNEVTTTAAGTAAAAAVRRLPGSSRLEIRGTVALGSAPVGQTLSVDNPTLFFVTVLRTALIAHGIDVRGPAVDVDEAGDLPARERAHVLMSYQSLPLSALATTLMKVSQNLYAETFLKTMGAAAGTPTYEGGRSAALAVIEAWGVEPGGLIMRDGSGLSRYNYVTPQTIVTILTHVERDQALRDPFEAALPIAATDGTLSRRMVGTPAGGNARAKTGSLSNVRALSGYVTTADGERLAFSIIANNFETPASVIDQASDAIVERLARFGRHGAGAALARPDEKQGGASSAPTRDREQQRESRRSSPSALRLALLE